MKRRQHREIGQLRELFDRYRRARRRRGLGGTLKLIAWKIGHACGYWTLPSRYRERRRDREFDHRFGIETSGLVELRHMKIDSQNVPYATSYEQTKPAAFDELMKHLNIHFEEFTFIDFGSGKGRAVLLASDYPFKKIIGVEFAPQLDEIAQQNVNRYHSATQKCRAIELHCLDVAEYVIPVEPAVFYFYNPFDAPVMTSVLDNIKRSLDEAPRPVFILYCNARLRDLVQQYGFTEIASSYWYSVLRNSL